LGSRVPVLLNRRFIDGQEAKAGMIGYPHGQRIALEQQPVLLFGFVQCQFRPFLGGDVAADRGNGNNASVGVADGRGGYAQLNLLAALSDPDAFVVFYGSAAPQLLEDACDLTGSVGRNESRDRLSDDLVIMVAIDIPCPAV